ncbi:MULTISPECIES: Smr/MutS family protein [unclassified Thioalkalivibrio]|uniref:Smr/MutS family protein n=1 Tax=unclassified Thioalkalivibrio TaxID=2621013 RepID=UPI00035C0FAF|nr:MULTISPECIES: Smr/MutS family protein [unclassified Thioalkalivibrio]
MSRLSIDLHECFRNGRRIDAELNGVIEAACDKRIKTVEIIHGKGSGQLKKRVLRFLQQPEVKARYHRLEKDSKNHGRLFVHFKH